VKPVNKFLTLLFLSSMALGCFDQPEFSDVPEIEYRDIYFDNAANTIFLSFSLRDGDGNVGILQVEGFNGNPVNDSSDPYHPKNFFLEDGTGNLFEIGTNTFYTRVKGIDSTINYFNTRENSGKLVTLKTRKKPNYTLLPAFSSICPTYSEDYSIDTLFVLSDDKSIIDNSYNIIDTVKDDASNTFYRIGDTTYYELNQQHYNIEVDWFVKISTNPNVFEEYNWREEFCGSTYDGRISQLTNTESPLEADVKYGIFAFGLERIFSVKTVKARNYRNGPRF
jgi:hypothetical protein